eukprot:287983_1
MTTEQHAELVKKFPDIDPFLLKKWERIFNVFFDRNASTEVDWGDFYLVVRQVRDIYGAQSEQMKYARSSMKTLWEALKKEADKNSDELIQVDEWVQILKGTDPKHENPWFLEYMGFMFKLFDVSADGAMDMAEYTDGMHCYGYCESECHDAFHKFAFDKKTKKPIKALTFSQFTDTWHDYFHSKDKNCPANHLFGILPADF